MAEASTHLSILLLHQHSWGYTAFFVVIDSAGIPRQPPLVAGENSPVHYAPDRSRDELDEVDGLRHGQLAVRLHPRVPTIA